MEAEAETFFTHIKDNLRNTYPSEDLESDVYEHNSSTNVIKINPVCELIHWARTDLVGAQNLPVFLL